MRPDVRITGQAHDDRERDAVARLAERWQGTLTWSDETTWDIEITDARPDDVPAIRSQLAQIAADDWKMTMHWSIARIAGGKGSGLVVWGDDYIRLNWIANAPDDAALPRLLASAVIWMPTVWRDVQPINDVARLSEFLALLHAEEREDGVSPDAHSMLDDVRAWRVRGDDGGDVFIVTSAGWI